MRAQAGSMSYGVLRNESLDTKRKEVRVKPGVVGGGRRLSLPR